MSTERPQPYELWRQADGDPSKYNNLLIRYGYPKVQSQLDPCELCATCMKPLSLHRDEVMDHGFRRLAKVS